MCRLTSTAQKHYIPTKRATEGPTFQQTDQRTETCFFRVAARVEIVSIASIHQGTKRMFKDFMLHLVHDSCMESVSDLCRLEQFPLPLKILLIEKDESKKIAADLIFPIPLESYRCFRKPWMVIFKNQILRLT